MIAAQHSFFVVARRSNPPPAALPIDSPERRRLPILLRRAWYSLNQAFRRRVAHLGITPDQFTVLRTLLENQGITQRRLTELMSSDPNTVASLVERMERAGLITRRPHAQDRRAYCIELRAAGERAYREARRIAIELQTSLLSVLAESQRETFLEQLALVADACHAAAEASPRAGSGRTAGK
jgi:DNA-binding MarR family transcriptional regulator